MCESERVFSLFPMVSHHLLLFSGGEDRSDTWSLDAIPSDSEGDRTERSDGTGKTGVSVGGSGGGPLLSTPTHSGGGHHHERVEGQSIFLPL